MKIELSKIRLPEKDLRAYVDQEALEELADSMRDNGQLQPVGVRRLAEDEYEIVFGARRYRAAMLNEWTHIDAALTELPDDQTTAKHKLIENVQRVSLTPIEEAYGLVEIIGDEEPNIRKLMRSTGKSRAWIISRLELIALPEDVQEAVQSGRLSQGVAKALGTVEHDGLRRQMIDYAIDNNLTAAEAEIWASNADAAETGISTMEEHEAALAEHRESRPVAVPLWNCTACRQPKQQTDCSMLVVCRQCMPHVLGATEQRPQPGGQPPIANNNILRDNGAPRSE